MYTNSQRIHRVLPLNRHQKSQNGIKDRPLPTNHDESFDYFMVFTNLWFYRNNGINQELYWFYWFYCFTGETVHSLYPVQGPCLEEKGPVKQCFYLKDRKSVRYSSQLALASENAPGGISLGAGPVSGLEQK